VLLQQSVNVTLHASLALAARQCVMCEQFAIAVLLRIPNSQYFLLINTHLTWLAVFVISRVVRAGLLTKLLLHTDLHLYARLFHIPAMTMFRRKYSL